MKTLLIETLLVFITFILGGILYVLDSTKIDIHSVPPKVQAHIDETCKGAKKYVNTGKRHNDPLYCMVLFGRYPEAFIESSSEEKPK